jgi:hypothetical protein
VRSHPDFRRSGTHTLRKVDGDIADFQVLSFWESAEVADFDGRTDDGVWFVTDPVQRLCK